MLANILIFPPLLVLIATIILNLTARNKRHIVAGLLLFFWAIAVLLLSSLPPTEFTLFNYTKLKFSFNQNFDLWVVIAPTILAWSLIKSVNRYLLFGIGLNFLGINIAAYAVNFAGFVIGMEVSMLAVIICLISNAKYNAALWYAVGAITSASLALSGNIAGNDTIAGIGLMLNLGIFPCCWVIAYGNFNVGYSIRLMSCLSLPYLTVICLKKYLPNFEYYPEIVVLTTGSSLIAAMLNKPSVKIISYLLIAFFGVITYTINLNNFDTIGILNATVAIFTIIYTCIAINDQVALQEKAYKLNFSNLWGLALKSDVSLKGRKTGSKRKLTKRFSEFYGSIVYSILLIGLLQLALVPFSDLFQLLVMKSNIYQQQELNFLIPLLITCLITMFTLVRWFKHCNWLGIHSYDTPILVIFILIERAIAGFSLVIANFSSNLMSPDALSGNNIYMLMILILLFGSSYKFIFKCKFTVRYLMLTILSSVIGFSILNSEKMYELLAIYSLALCCLYLMFKVNIKIKLYETDSRISFQFILRQLTKVTIAMSNNFLYLQQMLSKRLIRTFDYTANNIIVQPLQSLPLVMMMLIVFFIILATVIFKVLVIT